MHCAPSHNITKGIHMFPVLPEMSPTMAPLSSTTLQGSDIIHLTTKLDSEIGH